MKDTTNLVFIAANKKSYSKTDPQEFIGKTALFPDCTVSINHKWDNDITEHPIERGVSVADHIIAKNAVFSVSGIFNQYTLNEYTNNSVNTETKIKDAYEYLLALRDNRLPFTLVSKYNSYPDCVVKSLEIPVAPTDGNNTLIFALEIQQIRFAVLEDVTLVRATSVADPYVDTATSKTARGSLPLNLAVIKDGTFSKGTTITRVQDGLTQIPYRFGGVN